MFYLTAYQTIKKDLDKIIEGDWEKLLGSIR